MLGEAVVLQVFCCIGTEISGHQSPNSSMEIISVLSGKYKIFMFVHSVSSRVMRPLKIRWFTSCMNRGSRYSLYPFVRVFAKYLKNG